MVPFPEGAWPDITSPFWLVLFADSEPVIFTLESNPVDVEELFLSGPFTALVDVLEFVLVRRLKCSGWLTN